MYLLERYIGKETKEMIPTPAVRVVVTQPIPHWKMDDRIHQRQVPVHEIEFTRLAWILKGANAANPDQVMAPGGRITEDDEKVAREKWEQMQPAARDGQSEEQVLFQIAAWRHAFEKIHLQGMEFTTIHSIPNGKKRYTFPHPREGRIMHDETWVTVEAPWDFRPFVFHQQLDKIDEAVMLSPSETALMFANNELTYNGKVFPLVDNLCSNESSRTRKKVTADQNEVLRVRQSILDHIDQNEREYRLKLAFQMIYHSLDHPHFGGDRHKLSHDNWWQRLQGSLRNPTVFNASYHDLLDVYKKTVPKGPHLPAPDDALRHQMSAAWRRVQWEDYSRYAANLPIQGDLLAAAWLPLEQSADYEVAVLEQEGPENVKRVLRLINRALCPKVTADDVVLLGKKYEPFSNNGPDGILPVSERYRRLEIYQNLMIDEQDGKLADDALLFYYAWNEHMQAVFQQETGMTPEEFAQISELDKMSSNETERNIAPKVNESPMIPVQLRRHPSSQVSQFPELLLRSHGYSPYRKETRGTSLSPQAIIDTRTKLYTLFHKRDTIRSYYRGLAKSTYYWRFLLDRLSISSDQADAYVIYEKKQGKRTHITAGQASEGHAGVSVWHRETKLQHQGVPISVFEITNEKDLFPLYRKSVERRWHPEKIFDRSRTYITFDTESEEIKTHLQRLYQQQLSEGHPYVSYDDWVTQWAIGAIRETLVPGLKEQAIKGKYHFALQQEKDVLEDKRPTAGSAGSKGGYREYKAYVEMDLTNLLAGGEDHLSDQAQRIELGIFPTVSDLWTKIKDDGDYALRRFANVPVGSSARSLWNSWYPHSVYPVYSELAGKNIKRQRESVEKKTGWGQRLEKIFGKVEAVIYRR